jgi:hypothetical protein
MKAATTPVATPAIDTIRSATVRRRERLDEVASLSPQDQILSALEADDEEDAVSDRAMATLERLISGGRVVAAFAELAAAEALVTFHDPMVEGSLSDILRQALRRAAANAFAVGALDIGLQSTSGYVRPTRVEGLAVVALVEQFLV